MAARVVRQSDLNRVLDVLEKRGIVSATYEVLPGGAVRLHRVPPAANDTGDLDQERAEWDAALK